MEVAVTMHDYSAYGLHIRSTLELPELTAAPSPAFDPDVRVSLAAGDDPLSGCLRRRGEVFADAHSAFVDYPEAAAFLVSNGEHIRISPASGADQRLIRLYLLGPVFALLLHQRQMLVLHGSAVAIDGQAVVFVGDKGMGKSTMAAALLARGHALITDDLAAVDAAATAPLIHPAFPQLKLFPESAALLERSPLDLPRVHPSADKRARRIEGDFSQAPLPLARVYVLQEGEAESLATLAPPQAFMEMVRHTYLLAFLNATGAASRHFQQGMTLASRVRIARLCRRRSLEKLSAVAELVESDLARAA